MSFLPLRSPQDFTSPSINPGAFERPVEPKARNPEWQTLNRYICELFQKPTLKANVLEQREIIANSAVS